MNSSNQMIIWKAIQCTQLIDSTIILTTEYSQWALHHSINVLDASAMNEIHMNYMQLMKYPNWIMKLPNSLWNDLIHLWNDLN